MPDEKPEQESAADNGQEKPSEERKETASNPKTAGSAGGRSARSKEDASSSKAANGAKSPGEEPPKSDKSPVTEKPPTVPPPPPTSLYVVEVDNKSGVAIRIDHFNEKTGDRKELTDQEYKRIFPYARPARRPAPAVKPVTTSLTRAGNMPALKGRPAQTTSRTTFSADKTELVEAYYRGVADYIKALTSSW